MADKAGKAAKLISAATTGPIMAMLDKPSQQILSVPDPVLSHSLASLGADISAPSADDLALGYSPSLADAYALFRLYHVNLNTKINSMLKEWRQPVDSWTALDYGLQTNGIDYLHPNLKAVNHLENFGFLGMPESFLFVNAAMQTVAGYADRHEAQLIQIKDFATSFNVNEVTALTAELFPKTIAAYLRANPLTEAEWEEAARESHADGAEQGLAEIADMLDAPEQNRWQIIRLIWSIFFLILLAASGQTMVTDVQGFAARTLLNFISAISLTWASAFVPEVLQRWKSSIGSPPPLAVIVAADSRDVPVRKTGKPNSAILHRLPVGTLIPLAKEGTKEMKAVVADVDDNGEVIEVAWISRRNLKRIKMKQAYALKKMLPPR